MQRSLISIPFLLTSHAPLLVLASIFFAHSCQHIFARSCQYCWHTNTRPCKHTPYPSLLAQSLLAHASTFYSSLYFILNLLCSLPFGFISFLLPSLFWEVYVYAHPPVTKNNTTPQILIILCTLSITRTFQPPSNTPQK